MSQYKNCIATEGLGSRRVQGRWGAGESAGARGRAAARRWLGAQGARGARGARRRACGAGSWARRHGAQWTRRRASGTAGRAGSWATGARAAGRSRLGRAGRWAWACGLGVAWALGARPRRLGWPGLCTWCTRPFLARFDSVFS